MNRISQQVVTAFKSPGNRQFLHDQLAFYFKRAEVDSFIKLHLNNSIDHFATRMERELIGSDPIVGGLWSDVVREQVIAYDGQFLREMTSLIKSFIGEEPVMFSIGDGHCTTRAYDRGKFIATGTPNEMLAGWIDRPGRQITLRDDTANPHDSEFGVAAGFQTPTKAYTGGVAMPVRGHDQHRPAYEGMTAGPYAHTPPIGSYNGGRTGVTYGDMSGSGVNQFYDAYTEQSYMRQLNNKATPLWGTSAYGSMLDDEDLKAFTRRTFRSNEEGVENGIPKYRTWLHKREYERDVAETFSGGGERDFMQRGYDNSTLLARLAAKRAIAANAADRLQKMPQRSMLNRPEYH